jgi:hypothetical protein
VPFVPGRRPLRIMKRDLAANPASCAGGEWLRFTLCYIIGAT